MVGKAVSALLLVAALLLSGLSLVDSSYAGHIGASGRIAINGIYVMDPDGSGKEFITSGLGPRWSPDGTKIAFHKNSGGRGNNFDIYVVDVVTKEVKRLTDHPATDMWAAWSPDGSKIAFVSERDGNSEIYVMNADGSDQTRLTNHPASDNWPSWAPDGPQMAFTSDREAQAREGSDIYVMNADGTGVRRLLQRPGSEIDLVWSPLLPDGTSKLAFAAGVNDQRSSWEIFVVNAQDGSGLSRLTTSPGQDFEPTWSPDGTKIAFAANRDKNFRIVVMNADGTDQHIIANGRMPSWGI